MLTQLSIMFKFRMNAENPTCTIWSFVYCKTCNCYQQILRSKEHADLEQRNKSSQRFIRCALEFASPTHSRGGCLAIPYIRNPFSATRMKH